MPETTNLAKRLKEQKQRESVITQDLMRQQLDDMRRELTSTLQNELSTIKADIQSQSQSIGWSAFRSRFLWPTLIGLSLCLGIFGGSWGAMHYFGNQAIDLSLEIQAAKQVLANLPEGVEVAKEGNTTYYVQDLKIKAQPEVYRSKGGNWVIKVGK
ncbi:hypothetical protein VZ727_004396 [Salmonella enterica]|nr:hypothetical protein [Salmonella enterica]